MGSELKKLKGRLRPSDYKCKNRLGYYKCYWVLPYDYKTKGCKREASEVVFAKTELLRCNWTSEVKLDLLKTET